MKEYYFEQINDLRHDEYDAHYAELEREIMSTTHIDEEYQSQNAYRSLISCIESSNVR